MRRSIILHTSRTYRNGCRSCWPPPGSPSRPLALGNLALRGLRLRPALTAVERLPLAFALGTAGLGVITLVAGRLGLLAPWPVRVGLVVPIVIEMGCRFSQGRTTEDDAAVTAPALPARSWASLALVVAPFLVLMLLGAMLPTIEFDALEYHLQGPKEYFLAGRIAFLPHNVYTSMPQGVEMLHLLGMEVLDDWWRGALVGQVLVMLHAPAAALLIAVTTRRLASPRAAWVATVAYLTAPWITRLAVTPFVEGPLCLYHTALIWVVVRRWERSGGSGSERTDSRRTNSRMADSGAKGMGSRSKEVGSPSGRQEDLESGVGPPGIGPAPFPSTRLWLLAGLLAGGAMATKYPALISAVLPIGVVAGPRPFTGVRGGSRRPTPWGWRS